MVSRPYRSVIMLVLVCYFTSKIIVAYNKLREERVGTVFNTVSTDIIEVITRDVMMSFVIFYKYYIWPPDTTQEIEAN